MCSLNRTAKLLPVCPTYAFLQSRHVSLYTPDLVYLSVVWYLCVRVLWIVFMVRNAIFRLVCLNVLVNFCSPPYMSHASPISSVLIGPL